MSSVDVVVTSYQYGAYLRDCVSSVLMQDVAQLRVLIIDNASTDNSLEVATQLAREDARVQVIRHKTNLGRHASYNEGIDWASADYFMLLDADDILAPGCLGRAATCMDHHPEVSFTYGVELRLTFPAGVVPPVPQHDGHIDWRISSGMEFIEELCRHAVCFIGPTTVVRRTSAQKKVGHHRPQLPYTDDLEMFLRLATVGSVAYTSAVQAIRRLHGAQASSYYSGFPVREFVEREAAFNSFFAQEGAVLAEAKSLHAQVTRRLADRAYWSGWSHICRRQPRAGWDLLRYAWSRRPRSFVVPPIGELWIRDKPFTRLTEVAIEAITGRPYGRFAERGKR
jgi:glycosyltransferase involved in cell wall biosynthesis